MKLKVLIVEDESIVALDIKNVLINLGLFVTNTVTNHDDALTCVKNNEPDIILMDINLENSKDGIQTTQSIQKIKNIPVIYLTAFSDDQTIIRAIETNPLHYMIKPFKRDELKSTMQLAIYKINQEKNDYYEKNNFFELGNGYYYDMEYESLYYKDIPIRLGLKERQLLSILVSARGNIVPFERLIYEIWPDEFVSDSTLRTLIYRVRTKLEYKTIETIPAFGCKLTSLS